MKILRTMGLALGTAIVAMAGTTATAQTAMLDYESSARAAQVRESASWRLAFRPPLSVLRQTVSQLRNAPGVAPDVQKQVDAIVQESGTQSEPDARRTLWRAVTVLNGRTWTPEQEMLGALALKSPARIWTGGDATLTIEALYDAPARVDAGYTVDLFASDPTTSATPKKGALIRRVASGTLKGRFPEQLGARLSDIPDGSYLLLANVSTGAQASTDLVLPIYVVRDLDNRYSSLKSALSRIQGHEEAKSIAEYPYALAQAIRAGKREIISYDFPRAFQHSTGIVSALGGGRDEVRQAKGLQNRAYRFPETGELIPYQIYVPSTWSAKESWPLVVALHGANLDETNMLGRDDGRMQKLAEEHGFVVVAPLGYRLNSAYGSQRGFSTSITGDDTERRRRSEQDVLLVSDLVEKEYNIDPRRRYLTGNSMGGGGTWWIGGQHSARWAAIAPVAYGGVLPEDVPGLAKVPILAVVGDRDEVGMLEHVRSSVATLRAGGVNPQYIEVPGGTHAGAFQTVLPEIFRFFKKHAK
jgi:poly(3-hydroxybutyrate) depolymerase